VQFYVAFQLKKKFLARIDVKIFPRIGSADHHHDKVFVAFIDLLVAYRGFQQMPVLFDPGKKVKRRQEGVRHCQMKSKGKRLIAFFCFHLYKIKPNLV
jgi:hypothetical protein